MDQLVIFIVVLIQVMAGCQQDKPIVNPWMGSYQVEQICDGAANPGYTMKVRQDAAKPSVLILANLGGYGQKVEAILQNDSLVITPTEVNAGLIGAVRLSGTGTLKEILLINLRVRVPGPQGTTTTSNCILKGTRL